MKIESITLNHVSMPLVAPFETSFGRETDRECILITLHAGGLTGYGECVASRDPGYNYETTGTAWHILKDFHTALRSILVFARGRNRSPCWSRRLRKVRNPTGKRDRVERRVTLCLG